MNNYTHTHFDSTPLIGHEDLQSVDSSPRGFLDSILNMTASFILKCVRMIEDLYLEDEEDVDN